MEKITKSPWLRLLALLKLDKTEVRQLYIYAVFSGIVGLSLPLGIQSVIHFIQGGQITTSWFILIILVVLGIILTGVLQIMQLRITENIQQRIFTRYSFDLAYRFPRFNRMVISKENTSELMNRFFDIINIQKGVAKILLDFPSAFLQIAFSLIVLSLYHPLYIVFSIILTVVIVLIFKPLISKGFKTSLIESKNKYKMAYWLQEIARADWSFRQNSNDNNALKTVDVLAQNYIASRESHFKILWKHYLFMISIKAFIVLSLLGLGGYLVISQELNLGQFVAAEALILITLNSFEKIIQLLETLYDVFTSVEKIEQVRDLPLTYEDELSNIEIKDFFPLEIITTAQPLKTVLTINRGDKVLIKNSDSVTTTSLMRQLIDPTTSQSTCPRWNYTAPTQSMIATIFKNVGWFEKQGYLFDGTLRENIIMGRQELSQVDLEKVLKIVGLFDFIQTQPLGFDTEVSAKNKELSFEQRERILIARAIIQKPEIIIISLYGLSLEQIEIQTILSKIELEYAKSTIIIGSNIHYKMNWNQEKIN